MTTGLLLLALLGLAYLGALLTGSGRRGLPSHVEVAVLGLILGSSSLGVIRPATLEQFDPLARLAMSWLALGAGYELQVAPHGRERRLGLGLVLVRAMVVGASVGLVTHLALRWTAMFSPGEAAMVALGLGALACQRSHHALARVEDATEPGRVGQLLRDVISSSNLTAFLALSVLFAMATSDARPGTLPPAALFAAGPALGLLLGLLASAMIRMGFHGPASWGVLAGTAAIGTGLSISAGVFELGTMLFMGVGLRARARTDADLRPIFAASHRTVLLPLLALVGARVHLDLEPDVILVLGVAMGATVAATLLANLLVLGPLPDARRLGLRALLVYNSSGPLVLCAGFACLLRFPHSGGPLLLAFALATALASELLGLASAAWLLRPAPGGPEGRPE